jgi:integrase
MGRLTAATVRAAKHNPAKGSRPVRVSDGAGLYLQVASGGTKSWLFKYTLRGRAREMGLGPVGEAPKGVSLATARTLAVEAKSLLRAGRDPIECRRATKALMRAAVEVRERTFRAVSISLANSKRAGWHSSKHASQWLATLEAHAFPLIGDMPVEDVGTDAVLKVLRPIWERIPQTASRLRQRIEAVLDVARLRGWRTGENPARWKGHLAGELPPPHRIKRVRHHAALPWHEMPQFMTALMERDGIAAQTLRFAILTAARVGEVRGMRWREVDLDAKVWVVPGDRMKARKTHRVPLSAAALATLAEVQPFMKKSGDLVFPGWRQGRSLSDRAVSEVVRRMNEGGEAGAPPRWRDTEGRPVVPHGFRSTFRDWAGETRPEGREVVEAALAHTTKNRAEAAYARSDLLEKRRPLMDAWAEQCARIPADVVGFAGWVRPAQADRTLHIKAPW